MKAERIFSAIAANLTRQILIDHAKINNSLQRGSVKSNLPIEEALTAASDGKDFDLMAPTESLARRAETDSQPARIVELKFFVGLSPKIFLPTSKVVYNLPADILVISALNHFGKTGTTN